MVLHVLRRQATRCLVSAEQQTPRWTHVRVPPSRGIKSSYPVSGQERSDSTRLGLLRDLLAKGFADDTTSTSTSSSSSSAPSPSVHFSCFARAVRKHRSVTFLALTDGSLDDQTTLQAVVRGDEMLQRCNHRLVAGVAVEVSGRLQASKGKGQAYELVVDELNVTGDADAAAYPLRLLSDANAQADPASSEVDSAHQDRLTAERLRRYAHLRSRDVRHAAVLRMRDVMEGAMAEHFRQRGFTRVAAPILTASDCEGGGEVFRVEAAEAVVDEGKGKSAVSAPPSFWSDTKAFLTVSAQLHLESIALGLGRVYTVGPSFRAEGSATNRHLAEFWMLEGEQLTSSDERTALDEVTGDVEGAIRQAMRASMTGEKEERSAFLWQGQEDVRRRILACLHSARWPRMTYTQAINELATAASAGDVKSQAEWGRSLSSEQERWLARDGPVFVTHYPAEGKPFYMRVSDDGEAGRSTVACFDLLVPRLGELVGGSLRETRADVVQERLAASSSQAMIDDKLRWYVEDLRRFGCNPHGGFGLGVERLLSWLTNTDSVRDVVTFPRVKGPLHF